MMYSVSTMSAASAKRSMLMDIALRGYLMDQAQKQGMTEDEARDAVDQQIAQAKRSKTSKSFDDVVHEFMDSDLKENAVEPAPVVEKDPIPESEASVSQNERLFSSRTLQEEVPIVTTPVEQQSTVKEQEDDMADRMNSLSTMSTKELRKLVRENSMKKMVGDSHKTLTKEEEEHRELLRKQSMRKASKEVQDMVNYVIFLALFLIVVMNGRDDDTPFKMSLNLMNQLQEKPFPARVSHVHKTFEDVANLNEVYHYLSGVFYDAVYAGVSFDGDAKFPEGATYSPKGMIGGYGQIWGPIRIGQLRVQGQKCEGTMTDLLGLNTTLCYPEYSHRTASSSPFGYGETYTAEEAPDAGVLFTSPSERFYPGPNFHVYLNSSEPATCDPSTRLHCPQYEAIEALRTHKFFDMATRAIFIDLTVYNANFNQVSTIRLFFEQTASGGIASKGEFITYRLYNYIDSADYFRLACQLLILILVTYELYKEFRNWQSVGSEYLVPTNIIFVVNFLLFYAVATLRILSYTTLPDTDINTKTFANFRTPVMYFAYAEYFNSVICMLSWMKLFHFMTFIHVFAQLIKTITNGAKELSGLLVIFVLVLVGSSMAFHMTFGMRLEEFQTFAKSFLTLVKIILNKLEFQQLVETNRILGPLFFGLFGIIMIFVILNMFIVIITDAYVEVQDELESTTQVELNSISKEIVQHILYNLIFRIPVVGPRYLKPMYELAMKRTKEIVVTIQHRASSTSLVSAAEANPVISSSPTSVKSKGSDGKPELSISSSLALMKKSSNASALASVRESSCEIEHIYTSVLQKIKTQLSTFEEEGTIEDIKRFKAQLELFARQCDSALAS